MGPTDRSVDDAGTPMLVVVLLFCTAYYAASYFHSAMAKLTLPGPANAWVTENQTFALIPVSHTAGTLPIATLGRAPEIVYGLAREFSLVLNGLTLAVELCAVIVIARFRWLAIASVCWVLFHLAIFALSGIFFWKWALLDVVLAWVFWRLRGMRLSAGISLTAICIVVMTPRMLPTAHLGWYDTHSFKNSYFVAVTERGEKVRVPTNYFLSASLTMVQLRFVTWLGGPKLPTNVFGTSRDYQVKTAANECRLGPRPVQGTFAARTWDRLARFIRAHHAYVLSRVDGEGRLAYDLYPHHVWSNPGLFRAFADLDKRTIASYEFVMEQLCVGYAEGGLFNRYLSAESRPIVVR